MTQPITFEHVPGSLELANGVVQVYDAGNNPTTIIRTDSGWHAEVRFDAGGGLWSGMYGNRFHVKLHLEEMGAGECDLTLDSGGINQVTDNINTGEASMNPCPFTIRIPQTGDFAPGTVQAGTYKLIAVLTMSCNYPPYAPLPIAGFNEGMMVHFFDAA